MQESVTRDCQQLLLNSPGREVEAEKRMGGYTPGSLPDKGQGLRAERPSSLAN